MKLCKLLFAVAGATVLFGALVASAYAGRMELSSQTLGATWATMNFSGGFGTIECEVVLRGSFHTRTLQKVEGTLVGYITEGNVNRCARGGATVNRASEPWHIVYDSFVGTLPGITGVIQGVTGAEWTLREPTFGITCTVRRETSSTALNYTLSSGVVTRVSVSGASPCGSFTGTTEGTTTNVNNGAGIRITIRLI